MTMAAKLSLNEGSLARRTVLHVIAFVLGTAVFLTIASLVLTTIGHRVVNPPEKSASADESASAEDAPVTAPTGPGKLNLRPPRSKKPAVKAPEEEDQ